MANSKRKQIVYADFSGGFNDSVAAISINDNEVCVSENADYSAEIKSFKTRKGCKKVNGSSFGANITDAHSWSIGSHYKKCLVIGSKLYDYDEVNDTLGPAKITLSAGATKIYPFMMFNKFYFGDGTKLYSWGDWDLSSEIGSSAVAAGQIVRNNHSSNGVMGGFYKALVDFDSPINLKTENYTVTTNWENVTEVPHLASNVVRELQAFDSGRPEIVKVTVTTGSSAAGDIILHIEGNDYTVTVAAGDSATDIATAIANLSISGWTLSRDGNAVTCVNGTDELVENGYIDCGSTGAVATYVTQQEGRANDCDLGPIKKCTQFLVHTNSYRVFAAGNPDDNAIFYSEIGNPAYFASDINKVYAPNSYGRPTGMLQLSSSVLISYENGWYAWSGITPLEDASWQPLNIPYGCVAPRSIALTPYSFMYLGRDGIYNISASILNDEIVMIQGSSVIEKITKNKVDNAIASIKDLSKCEAIFRDNAYYLAYNVDGAEGNTRVLKYEWDTDSFTEITGWLVNAWMSDSDYMYFASKNYLLRTNYGYSDVNVDTGKAAPINLYIKTKEYHFGNPFVDKVVNLIGLIFKQPTISTNVVEADVSLVIGYETIEYSTIDISESLVWGRDWGKLWGFREAIAKMIEITRRSNTFQLIIQNHSLDSPVSLVAIGFVYQESDFITPTMLKDEDLLK